MIAIVANLLPASPQAWLDVLWMLALKATLVLALAALAAWAMRRASAAARHLAWSAGLVGVLALVPLTLWGPEWSIPGLTVPRAAVSETLALSPESAGKAEESAPPAAATGEVAGEAAIPPAGNEPLMPGPPAPAGRSVLPSWPVILVVVWATGATLILGGLIAGAIGLAHLTRRARPITSPAWLGLLERCREQIGVARPVDLLAADGVPSPCTWGFLRPRLLVPAQADQWPIERRRVVLLHELAHVARHDCLLQALGQVACGVFWFHPLAWLASRQQRTEREFACDDLVLRSDTQAADYADHLLAVVRALRDSRLAAMGAVAFARRSQFEGRLLAVLDPARARGTLTWRRAWPALIAAALMVLPLATLRPWVDSAGAGLTLFHGDSGPEDGAASEVVRADEDESLTQRLGWAFNQASRDGSRKGFWVGYRIGGSRKDGGLLSDNAPVDLNTLGDDWPGPRLADVIAGRSARGRDAAGDGLAILLHYSPGGARPEGMDRIRVQTLELPAVFGHQPLFWLGEVEDSQSLAWMRSLESRTGALKLRSTALDAIAHHDAPDAVRAHLVDLLRSDAPDELRGTAAERLGRFPDRFTLDLLTETLRRDRSREVRERAIKALGQMRSEEATRTLSTLARSRSESDHVRRLAINALGQKATHDAVESLEDLAQGGPSDVFDGLPDERIDRMADEAADDASDSVTEELREAREDAREAVEDLEDFEDLKDLKKDKKGVTLDGNVRIVGRPGGQDIEVLGDDGAPEVTIQQRDGKQEIKTHPSSDEQVSLQRQAVESLGRLPEDVSMPRLVRIAETHPDVSVRRKAVETIGYVGTARAFEALRGFVRDRNLDVARQAVESLEHLRPAQRDRVMDVLDEIIWKDWDESLQHKAVDAVGRMPESQGLPRLERIARAHPSARVRRVAIEWIGHADPDKATPILERLIDGKSRL